MGQYKNINPGPGAYNPYDLNAMKDKPKYTFGTKNCGPRKKKKVPGPGTYFDKEAKSEMLSRPSSKFGRQQRGMNYGFKSRVPGPGRYRPKKKMKRP